VEVALSNAVSRMSLEYSLSGLCVVRCDTVDVCYFDKPARVMLEISSPLYDQSVLYSVC
jgi:hypothetical protein